MKNFLSVALIVVVILFSGCGSNYSDEVVIKPYAVWLEDKKNLEDIFDALNDADTEYLEQHLRKIKMMDKETKVAVTDEFNNGKYVEIKFLQGRYKNKVGYTESESIIDVGKERELAKKEEEERKAAEEKKLEEQAKRDAEEKTRVEQLASDGNMSTIQEGVRITCTMAEGTSAYQKLLGKTNLPEETHLSITLAGVNKASIVQKDGFFTALFERRIIPVGEQPISIKSLDRDSQPVNVQTVEDSLIKETGNGILGKELYTGRIAIK